MYTGVPNISTALQLRKRRNLERSSLSAPSPDKLPCMYIPLIKGTSLPPIHRRIHAPSVIRQNAALMSFSELGIESSRLELASEQPADNYDDDQDSLFSSSSSSDSSSPMSRHSANPQAQHTCNSTTAAVAIPSSTPLSFSHQAGYQIKNVTVANDSLFEPAVTHTTSLSNAKPPSVLMYTVSKGDSVVTCARVGRLKIGLGCANGNIHVIAMRDENPLKRLKSADELEKLDPSYVRHHQLFDYPQSCLSFRLTGHRGSVLCLDFASYDGHLLSGGYDGTIRLWNTFTRSCLCIYRGHDSAILDLRFTLISYMYVVGFVVWRLNHFSPYDYYFVSGSRDCSARVWAQDSINNLRVFSMADRFHYGEVICVDFHPNAHYIATGCQDRYVRVFDISVYKPDSTVDMATKESTTDQVGSLKRQLAAAVTTAAVSRGQSTTHHNVQNTVPRQNTNPLHLTQSNNNNNSELNLTKNISISHAMNDKNSKNQLVCMVRIFSGHKSPVAQVKFSQCGQYLITAGCTDDLVLVFTLSWTSKPIAGEPPAYIVNTLLQPSCKIISDNSQAHRRKVLSISPASPVGEASLKLAVADCHDGSLVIWNLSKAISEDRNSIGMSHEHRKSINGERFKLQSIHSGGRELHPDKGLLISQQYTKATNLIMSQFVNRDLIVAIGRLKAPQEVI